MHLPKLYRRESKKPLKVYWWRYDFPNNLNFGDELTPLLVERLFGRKTVWADPSNCDIAGAGSIIEIVQRLSQDNRVKIWGSGFIKPGDDNQFNNLEFFAVRGKRSRARINNDSIQLGDPGILLPLIINPSRRKKYKLGIVPHYVDSDHEIIKQLGGLSSVKIIDVLDSVERVIDQITSCEMIVSSSLHGLIVSDAYGVPNSWIKLSNKLTGKSYKFEDYYSAYDISAPNPILPSGASLSNIEKTIASQYKLPAKLSEIQKNLVASFPYQ